MVTSERPLKKLRALILGGTSEANDLIDAIASIPEVALILALAGRTQHPKLPNIPTRIGGFGGAAGLQTFLVDEKITVVIDATHPYAAQISANARLTCAATTTPYLRVQRPEWAKISGDIWHGVTDVPSAVLALGAGPHRVFLTHGRLGMAEFAKAPQHFYLVRAIEPPPDFALLPNAKLILARGPFCEAAEYQAMQSAKITRLVSKNSGGAATYGKIAAARALQIPVILLQRPKPGLALHNCDLQGVMQWLRDHVSAP